MFEKSQGLSVHVITCSWDRVQGDVAAQPLGQPATPRQRFSPFKRPVRAGQPRPGSARAVLAGAAAAGTPGSGAPPGPREGGGVGTPGQRSDVPMQRLLGGKARLRPVVRGRTFCAPMTQVIGSEVMSRQLRKLKLVA